MKFIKRGAQIIRYRNNSSKMIKIDFIVKKDPDYFIEFNGLKWVMEQIQTVKNILLFIFYGVPM